MNIDNKLEAEGNLTVKEIDDSKGYTVRFGLRKCQ